MLLMIPGPIEVSEAVQRAYSIAPPSHVAPDVIDAFGASLEMMREVWLAGEESQPFVVAGSGTLAMEMAAANMIEPGDPVLVVNTGYFSDRMVEMLRRRGAAIEQLIAPLGGAPSAEKIEEALSQHPYKAVFATHVDTSTGVRVDAEAIARAARERGVLSVFDGVCATAGEAFEMEAWGADVYLTGSQKAVGLPAGLALLVASPRALEARDALETPPPMSMDYEQWLPIMSAYEARKPSYFATPATNLIMALYTSLRELLDDDFDGGEGIRARIARHQRVADAMRAGWQAMGLELVPTSPELAANTLSAIRYPEGVDASLTARVKAHGVVVAGGLHPKMKTEYFRVGHMGDVTTRHDDLVRTVEAIEAALKEGGFSLDEGAGPRAVAEHLG